MIISSATTKFKPYETNRNTNIEIASNKINGVILKPGETFSFNKIVGERTEKNGFKEATSIDNKKLVKSIGGGICQVSTTLNMAVKKAGLDIIEVHIHSIPVHYAKREDEASVSWGEKDYIFKNNKTYPIKINSKINKTNSSITVSLEKV